MQRWYPQIYKLYDLLPPKLEITEAERRDSVTPVKSAPPLMAPAKLCCDANSVFSTRTCAFLGAFAVISRGPAPRTAHSSASPLSKNRTLLEEAELEDIGSSRKARSSESS